MKKFSKIAAVAMFGFAAMGANAASPATGTFDVTINLTPTCLVTAPGNAILNYTSFGGAASTTVSGSIKCTSSLAYSAAVTGTQNINGIAFTVAGAPATATGSGGDQAFTLTVAAIAGQGGTCNVASPGVCTGTETQTLTVTY